MAFGTVALELTLATQCERYLVLRYSFHSIIQFLSSKKLSPPSLLVKIFSLCFPFIYTPNFPHSLFFYPEYGSNRFLWSTLTLLQEYAVSHPPEQYSTHSLPCEPHNLHSFQKRLLQVNLQIIPIVFQGLLATTTNVVQFRQIKKIKHIMQITKNVSSSLSKILFS